ncbi:Uncharacterised protein g10343 [Pycnogonum litorale]
MARELIGKVMPREELSLAVDEWKVYQVENLDEMRETERIDHYWRQIFSIKCQDGSQKFPLLEKIVKPVMIIPHGNSDVERGFSDNKRMIGTDKTVLSEASLNGIRTAKDAVNWYDPEHKRPENVPLTKDVVQAAVAAHKSYQNRLETQRLEEEAKKREKQLNEKESKNKNRLKVGLELVQDAQKELSEAIEKNDINRVSKAKLILDSGHKECKLAQEELDKITEESNSLRKKKSSLIIKALSKGKDSSETISKEKPSSQVSKDKYTTSSHGSKVHKQSSHMSKDKQSSSTSKDKHSSSTSKDKQSSTASKDKQTKDGSSKDSNNDKRKRSGDDDSHRSSKKQKN